VPAVPPGKGNKHLAGEASLTRGAIRRETRRSLPGANSAHARRVEEVPAAGR
jgi:hypothetical protein